MELTTLKAFTLLRKIKSVAFSTVNDDGPDVRIIDVMLAERDGLYFLTGRGKPFYKQLVEGGRVAICGMTPQYVTARVMGDIRRCEGRGTINKIFEANPMMSDLYPGKKRDILEAFHLYKGKGEIFDLSVEPPHRERFAFGGEQVNAPGPGITEACTACGLCAEACPMEAISKGDIYVVDGSHCLECGRCAEICPENAIEEAQGL